jgi:hypothetical protein
MTTLILLATGFGLGLWALAVWLVPPAPPLTDLLTRVRPTPQPTQTTVSSSEGWAVCLGRPFVGPLRSLGLPGAGIRRDLAVTDRTPEVHLAECAALALTGLLLPAALGAVLTLGGRPVPMSLPLAASVGLSIGGFLLPNLTVRAQAKRQRASFRHALSAYLDLIDIFLAGGAGVDGALSDAVTIGRGWSFAHLRRALHTAELTRTTPWATLGHLGEELDIAELSQLSATLSLAGTEGAKVRASLSAKAEALRSKGAANAEAAANAATERMSVPAALMAFGFIAFVFYPALSQVSASL